MFPVPVELRFVNNLGFFNWVRDGVKQSVLLGVSDALETIGTPEQRSELHPALLAFAQQPVSDPSAPRMTEAPAPNMQTPAGRKRLGRSLKDINPTSGNSTGGNS